MDIVQNVITIFAENVLKKIFLVNVLKFAMTFTIGKHKRLE